MKPVFDGCETHQLIVYVCGGTTGGGRAFDFYFGGGDKNWGDFRHFWSDT